MGSFVGFRLHPTPQELIGHYLMKKRFDPAFSVDKIRDAKGFRFHPTPQELIGHYLMKKRLDPAFSVHKIRDANIYGYEPSELPRIFPVHPDEQEWHFFCEPDYKYTKSKRVNRRTRGGNWKVTGKKRDVKDECKKVIGWKITLVFYEGSGNSKEARTNWVMHEYHIENDPLFKKEFVVIRIRRNTDIKHDSSSSTNEDIPSPNVISSSGNHYSENIDLQTETDFGHQPLSNHDIPFNGEEISSNHDISFNNEFQPTSLNYSEFQAELQEISSKHDISFNNEYQPTSLNHSEELQEISSNHDISFNSEFRSPSSNYGEFQTELSNYSEQEDQRKNSRWGVADELYGKEAVQTHPHNFDGSKLITGANVHDSYDAAEAETIPAALSEFPSTANGEYVFPSMANGEYYFNWIYPSESYPALDGNILPL